MPTKQAWSNTCYMMITINMATSFKFHKLETKWHATQVQDLLQLMWNSYICKKKWDVKVLQQKRDDIKFKDLQT